MYQRGLFLNCHGALIQFPLHLSSILSFVLIVLGHLAQSRTGNLGKLLFHTTVLLSPIRRGPASLFSLIDHFLGHSESSPNHLTIIPIPAHAIAGP
jgi:hypothetical protein